MFGLQLTELAKLVKNGMPGTPVVDLRLKINKISQVGLHYVHYVHYGVKSPRNCIFLHGMRHFIEIKTYVDSATPA